MILPKKDPSLFFKNAEFIYVYNLYNILLDFLIFFIPRREPAKAAPDGVQLILLWLIAVISERKMELQFCYGFLRKKTAKNLYCAGGGWWVDGGQKGPSILLKFKYIKN